MLFWGVKLLVDSTVFYFSGCCCFGEFESVSFGSREAGLSFGELKIRVVGNF